MIKKISSFIVLIVGLTLASTVGIFLGEVTIVASEIDEASSWTVV